VNLVWKLAKNMNQMNLTNVFWRGAAVIVTVPIVFLLLVGLFQGLTGIQQWLIPISGCVTLITISIGSWLAFKQRQKSSSAYIIYGEGFCE